MNSAAAHDSDTIDKAGNQLSRDSRTAVIVAIAVDDGIRGSMHLIPTH